MLHAIRWQLLALLLAVLLFGGVLAYRISQRVPVSTPAAPTATVVTLAAQASATPTFATPASTTEAALLTQPADDVPTFREVIVGTVQRINPLFVDLNPVDRDISALIFEGLTRINSYGEPVGSLAKAWHVSSDGLEYVVELRDDILWQDGIPFSADDVIYTMGLLHDPALPTAPDVSKFWRTVETERINAHLVRFRLTQPLSSFLNNLTIGILPEHALRGTTAAMLAAHPFNLSPIGTGAYQLEALRSRDGVNIERVDLRAAPTFRQRPEGQTGFAVERFSFLLADSFATAKQWLQDGAADGMAAQVRQERVELLGLRGMTSYTALAPAVGILLYNWDEGEDVRFFRELRVRLALQRGLNRATPVESHLANQAIAADSPLLPNSWGYVNLPYPPVSVPEALGLLENANIVTPQKANGEDVYYAFSILVPADDPSLARIAQEIATQWSQLRLRVTVETAAPEVFAQRIADGAFRVAIVELPLNADPDIFGYWHVGQAPDGKNYGSVADDRLSEVLERARRDPFGINRIQLYRQFQSLFIERAIALPLYYPLFTYSVRNSVQNVQLGFISTPADRFRTLGEWLIAR